MAKGKTYLEKVRHTSMHGYEFIIEKSWQVIHTKAWVLGP